MSPFPATRRDVLKLAGLGMLGVQATDAFAGSATPVMSNPTGASVIFLWLDGGPSHYETFDPKPGAPADVRGPYGSAATDVPGVRISELLPMLGERMSRFAIVRSMTHPSGSHSPIPMMTGIDGKRASYGAVLSKMLGSRDGMPAYVHIGSRLGVGGGELGATFDPVAITDPSDTVAALKQFTLTAGVSADRFKRRTDLLGEMDRSRRELETASEGVRRDEFYRRAAGILTSTRVRDAFDLTREKDELRERYGNSFFGQSCLLARRLVQAGTRFVQVKWYDGPAWDAWDVHGADLAGIARMEQHLCPRFDQGVSTLLDDLAAQGMLENTLVVAVGEFGRTPKINKYAGRDHWSNCFSAMFAGAGVPGGAVIGASDNIGAYPAHSPVSPAQFAATIYEKAGIPTGTDLRIRPFLNGARPIAEFVK